MRDYLIGLPRSAKQLVALGTDTVGFALSAIVATWLLFGTYLDTMQLVRVCLTIIVIGLPMAWYHGLYRSVVRYMGLDLFMAGAKTAAGTAIVGTTVLYLTALVDSPFRWVLAFWGMAFIYICSSRYVARVLLLNHRARIERERVIIYGAGSAGAGLAISLYGGDDFWPVAMVDDDPLLSNRKVKGLVVYPSSEIESIIRQNNVTRVLLAMPSASRRKRRAVLERLSEFPVHVQTIPEITELVSGAARVDHISDVVVEDLLGRDSIPPNPDLLAASITGQSVMVTGAGGSIGSELCRQIVRLNPKTLILLDQSEIALYNIDKELQSIAAETGVSCELVPLIGSVHHKNRMEEALRTFKVKTLYHAAAYKHLPIVETNLLEGVHNNIFGTLHTAEAAINAGVDTFVLISTDKAVSPTSVMGATKRFAELILQALQEEHRSVRFCMVRFGNVLESSGSVVPLFRKQIREGGPVTVTHRDIIRYFMTIPEAAQLVIQAAAMARGGDVFVLDMGEPVKILNLALRMINLMGQTVRDDQNPDGDIEIKFTGLRPAEKLYEELLIGSNVSGTRHPRIMRATEEFIALGSLSILIDELRSATSALDRDRTREILLRSVHGYGPPNGIEDLVWVNQRRSSLEPDSDTVVDFSSHQA